MGTQHMRIVFEQLGGHVHTRWSMGKDADHLQGIGQIIMGVENWLELKRALMAVRPDLLIIEIREK